tara:strand:+ start:697 stop:936 length:240 start_codon:yes stop_codon:yes gene_type:complete
MDSKDYKDMKKKQLQIKTKINKIVKKITELELDKVSLMILYREMGMDMARKTLEDAFSPQLQKLLKDKQTSKELGGELN